MMLRKPIGGYFTTENNIRGLSTLEIERRLGFPVGRCAAGALVWVLTRQPRIDEFEPRGSTKVPDGHGLVLARLTATHAIPGAWHNQRLVKVETRIPHAKGDEYPRTKGIAAEQWQLTAPIEGLLVQDLRPGDVYWGNR